MRAVALLLIVGAAHIAPEAAAHLLGGSIKAWEFVGFGIETSALWWLLAWGGKTSAAEHAVCLYGMYESVQRPIFRAMLPMDQPPQLPPGVHLSDVATGLPVSSLSPIILCWVIWQIVKELWRPTKVCSSNAKSDGA